MMDWGTWGAFVGASVLLTLMPGPDILFVAARAMAGSPRDGSAIGLGLCTGLLAHISAAALGISAIVYRSDAVFLAVKALGAAYLFYLAWQAWRGSMKSEEPGAVRGGTVRDASGSARAAEGREQDRDATFWRLYRRGIWMNLMNPKVSLFFVAFLPQFVSPGGGPVALQMAVYGATFLAQALVIFQLVALAAGKLGRLWTGGPSARRGMARFEAAIYAVLGALLIFQLL